MKKKKNSGCGFVLLCILFLLPGVYLLREQFPSAETAAERIRSLRNPLEVFSGETAEDTEEQKAALLADGTEKNGCSYYYWLLDESMRTEYMRVLNGLVSMEEKIEIRTDEEGMKRLVKMIFADHPELFWAEQSYEYTLYENRVQIRPRYTCSGEERDRRRQQIEQTVQEGLQSVPEGASVYEVIRALYTYVVRTVEYDSSSSDNQNIYSSMVNRVSVCTGYAKELQYLLQRAGIQALLVEGTAGAEQMPHAWLIGFCDGMYYHIDPTFGDPTYQEESGEETADLPEALQVDYTYLCCDTATILRGHSISPELEVPDCPSDALLYYPLHGLLFSAWSDEILISLQQSIDQGNRYWEGQFADWESYQEMTARMQEGVFSSLILANHPDWESVRLHMSCRDESLVVKLWY